ncbi:MAG TPA: FHA domain-containing protein [Enhygromyxa sp.]|nr:FHA domain-containing protein [Enhygromyxa sp.]
MALLEDQATGERYWLSARHLLGRAPACQLRVDEPRVSGFHAELIWDGRRWIQDLGSRNGTVVGTQTLAAGEQVELRRDTELVLAGRRSFRLVDDSAPHLVATAADGEVRIAENELLSLPSDDAPELTIYRDLDGTWVVEARTKVSPASEGETLFAGGRPWRLTLPTSLPDTRELDNELRLHALEFRFFVSRDQEHVELTLECGSGRIELEPRAHLALLLLLARTRLDDGRSELPESERGWVQRDELPKMLGVEPHMTNLWIHRARKQLADHKVRDAGAIIERRANATQLRIGVRRLLIAEP